MRHLPRFSLCAIAALGLGFSSPVMAQELAEEVIVEYFKTVEDSGLSVRFDDKIVTGPSVEFRNIKMENESATGETVNVTIDFIRATEVGNQTVRVETAPVLDYVIGMPDLEKPLKLSIEQSGMTWMIFGPADQRTHDYDAETLTIKSDGEGQDFEFNIVMSDTAVDQVYSGDDIRNAKGSGTIGDVAATFRMDDGETKASGTYSANAIAMGFDADAISEENAVDLLNGKRNFAIEYSVAGSSLSVDATSTQFAGNFSSTAGPGTGRMAVQGGVVALDGVGTDVTYKLDAGAMGMLPMTATLQRAETEMGFSLKKEDTASPVTFMVALEQLALSDSLWGMLDPGQVFARDPATVKIDLSAMMKWLVDPVMLEETEQMPVEITSVSLNDLTVEAAGAKLTAVGAADINNAGPVPEPIGKLNADLKGGFALLDALIKYGLVPEEQAMGIRMMSGLFANKGPDGDDHLISEVEAKEGGAIFINGQRIK